jgi:hypothetical protein
MEKAGKPSVGIVSAGFEHDAMATARAFGLPQFRYAQVPSVITGLKPDEIERDITGAVDRIVEVLTTDPADSSKAVALKIKPARRLRIEAADSYAAFELMNEQFLEQTLGDGLPLIPPTPEKVARMLEGTKRGASDVVTILAPGNGLATVEKIAINGVMAGCQPIHMPVLIAICEAYAGLGNRARGMAMSTSPHAPLLVINGPIAKKIGINSKRCSMGPGAQSRHNIVLGRALRLMMINIGNCRPGVMDMDTMGSARKFGMCVAENEEESPWPALNVEKGLAPGTSTVTIFSTRDEVDVNDLGSFTPEGVVNSLAYFSAIPGGDYLEHRHAGSTAYALMFMIGPEHANICGKAGWDKKAVKDYIYQRCRTSATRLLNQRRNAPETIRPQWQWLLKKSEWELEQMMLPVMESANEIEIVVVGGPAGKDLVYRCNTAPATAVIDDPS